MRKPSCACLVLLFAALLTLAQPGDDVARELQAYYANRAEPKWKDAIKRLTAESSEQRARAVRYLIALLDQAQNDEIAGNVPWFGTPFFGGGGENHAHVLRKRIADEMAKSSPSPESLSVIRWFLERGKSASLQQQVMEPLKKGDGVEADRFCLSLLSPAHENAAVVLAALDRVGERKIEVAAGIMKELCDSYRPRLRTAARKLHAGRGGADPGPFDEIEALKRPAIAKLMSDIEAVLDRPVPSDARFMKAFDPATGFRRGVLMTSGWLVDEDGAKTIVSPMGQRKKNLKKTDDAYVDLKAYMRWVEFPIADAVKSIVEEGRASDRPHSYSEYGRFLGGNAVKAHEVVLAWRLYKTKRFDLCAPLLFPALDDVYADRHLTEMVHQSVGEVAGLRMLVAFVGDRDLAEAQRLADMVVRRYPATRHHSLAGVLAKELPRRQGDFDKLKLPSHAEWAELRKKLTKNEQIAYLADRLRLLNVSQLGQGFGPHDRCLEDMQYAEACGLADDASWLGRGRTRVINPLVQLVGGKEGYASAQSEEYPGVGLTVADIPRLAPYLREDWHVLCVTFWRDFAPARQLDDTTRQILVPIINRLAKHELCTVETLGRMTPAELEKEIERIAEWPTKSAGKSEGTILREALDLNWQPGKVDGKWLKPRLARLTELKDDGFIALLHRRRADPDSSVEELAWCLSIGRKIAAADFRKEATRLLDHEDSRVQQQASLVLHALGERKQAHDAMGRVLEKGRLESVGDLSTAELLRFLLDEGTPEARTTIDRLFANPRLLDIGYARSVLLRVLLEGNHPGVYRFYLRLLDDTRHKLGSWDLGDGTVAERIAYEIVQEAARDVAEYNRIETLTPRYKAWIAPLKDLLRKKAESAESSVKGG
jgi:hypothetical protein